MTEQEKIDRGQRAAAMLNDPLFCDALAALTDDCLREFADADPTDIDSLRHARMMLQVAHQFQSLFRRYVQEGKNAALKADFEPHEVN